MKNRALATNNPASQGLKALFREHKEAKEKHSQDRTIKSNHDLLNLLKETGKKWREEHKEVKKKNGQEVEIVHHVPARSIAYMLEKHLKTAVIGDSAKDVENAPLSFYDLDTGLYTNSDRLLDSFILAVDDTTNSRARKDIREWLRIEAPTKSINKNINLVPVGNGIFDKENKKLLPFDPKYGFTSKVATKYVDNDIPEPTYNGWTFSKWIKELSNGDEDKTTLLWQMIASVIQNRRTSNVLFCLIDNGEGALVKVHLKPY